MEYCIWRLCLVLAFLHRLGNAPHGSGEFGAPLYGLSSHPPHSIWIDRILKKIGPESEANYDGPEEKGAAALQRRANLKISQV
jgi:hypothetical protein